MRTSHARRPWTWTAVLLVLPCLLLGCDYLEQREIEKVLDQRARAIRDGNAKAYLAFFAPDYRDQWTPFEQLKARAFKRLGREPRPVISFGKREIWLKGNQAQVSERFTIEDTVQGRPRRYDEVHHLALERRSEGWVCVRGSELLRLLGGRMEEEHEIEQVLLRREAALVNKDLKAYLSLISTRYRHRGEGPEQLRENLVRNFQVYDDIEIRSYDRKIWFFGDTATVDQRFTMHANQVGSDQTFSGRERFELEKTEDGWKFTKGL